jgi:hypothetical protein
MEGRFRLRRVVVTGAESPERRTYALRFFSRQRVLARSKNRAASRPPGAGNGCNVFLAMLVFEAFYGME